MMITRKAGIEEQQEQKQQKVSKDSDKNNKNDNKDGALPSDGNGDGDDVVLTKEEIEPQ